jgi:hypothetical protein
LFILSLQRARHSSRPVIPPTQRLCEKSDAIKWPEKMFCELFCRKLKPSEWSGHIRYK